MYGKMKKNRFEIRISQDDKVALEELATQLDLPASHIVRDAIKEKIAEVKPRRKKKVETT